MRNNITKIALIIVSGLLFYSCSLTRRVPGGKQLLKKNDIQVNGDKKTDEEVTDQLYLQPNTNLLGYHLRLHLYNLAKPNADSSYLAWLERKPGRHERLAKLLSEKQVRRLGNSFIVSGLSNFLKKTGEPPVLIDSTRIKKSAARLMAYYYKKGYFRTTVGYKVDSVAEKKAVVTYNITTGKAYKIDTLSTEIESPLLDSLYQLTKKESLIKRGEQYNEDNLTKERARITDYFQNHGAYTFEQSNISFVVDTIGSNNRANVDIIIDNETVRQGDSTFVRPFRLYKISDVNVFTQNPSDKTQAVDTTLYKGFTFYSVGKMNYRPKAISDAIFITPGSTYAEFRRVLTTRYLTNLGVFSYPRIQFVQDPRDSTGTSLITNISLSPLKKFKFYPSVDFNHSNIQDFGIQGTVGYLIRNLFRGAEVLQLSARGNIGASRDPSIPDRTFFNIFEYGADAKLTFPRIFFPISTEKVIPKRMIPLTMLSFGISRQQNIGLDKENFTSVLNYNWNPKHNVTAKLDLFNIQYIRNINADHYYYVYKSSYGQLNDIAHEYASQVDPDDLDENGDLTRIAGAKGFTQDVQDGIIAVTNSDKKSVRSIEERRQRLTEDNLISATNFTYTTGTQQGLNDNTSFVFKTKVETAGNTMALLYGLDKAKPVNENGNKTIFDVAYSQYVKTELEFIKHWDLRRQKVLAMRAFFGIAIPYGNSNSIPFTRSYFGGGSNDNRGWQSYSLGPGSSGGVNDFNEANLKMAYNAELRFNIFGKLNGAVFGDVGNIWNVFDSETDESKTFNGLKSFRDLAFGTGFGFRYDFNYFVIRFDLGFKAYDPGRPVNDRWFKGLNFAHSVLNVGINYPF